MLQARDEVFHRLMGVNIAIRGYRLGLAMGAGGTHAHVRLAWLYLAQRSWGKAAAAGWHACCAWPVQLWYGGRRSLRRLTRRAKPSRSTIDAIHEPSAGRAVFRHFV